MSLFSNDAGIAVSGSGYNTSEINALRDVINKTAQASATGIVEKLEEGIVAPMSSAWCAQEAVNFFEAFAKDVKATGEQITKIFDSFRNAVQTAGQNWADSTGNELPNLAPIDTVELNLDVSSIQKDSAGTVFLNEAEAEKVAANLSIVESEIIDELKSLSNELSAESAFIGGGQAGAIEACYGAVCNSVHKIFDSLTNGDESSLQSQIKKWASIYSERAESTAQAFTDASSNLQQ